MHSLNVGNLLPPIFKTLFGAFIVALLAKSLAIIFQQIHGHETAFDQAVSLLMHYPDSFHAIFSFLAVNLILLFLTILFEPSDLGFLTREWAVLPSLRATEHMLALSAGAYMALAVIESMTTGIPYGSLFKTAAAIIYVCGFTVAFALICAMSVTFIERDYSMAVQRLGRYRVPALLLISIVMLWALYKDYVLNFSNFASH